LGNKELILNNSSAASNLTRYEPGQMTVLRQAGRADARRGPAQETIYESRGRPTDIENASHGHGELRRVLRRPEIAGRHAASSAEASRVAHCAPHLHACAAEIVKHSSLARRRGNARGKVFVRRRIRF
jgi:hypothetical protein